MSDIELHAGSALAITEEQTFWNQKQRAALEQIGVGRAHDADLAVFFHQCQRTGLDPFARQIYMIERQGKQTIQTGIDGFRLIARRAVNRSGETLGYEDTLWCDNNGRWTDVWLSKEPPAAAKVTVVRNGDRFPAVALFSEYAGRKRDGGLMQMWATKGSLMIGKCAEALALRKAFPQDLSGLYTADEMAQADNAAPARQSATRTSAAPARSNRDAAMQALNTTPQAKRTLDDEQVAATLEWVEGATDVAKLRAKHDGAAALVDDQREWIQQLINARIDELTGDDSAAEVSPEVDAEVEPDTAA